MTVAASRGNFKIMATVSFTHVGYITSINPGATLHWWWNNAADERVRSFSVDSMVPSPFIPGTVQVEITRVEYRQIYNGSSFEREVHFWIKNTGSVKADFAVHMATIAE